MDIKLRDRVRFTFPTLWRKVEIAVYLYGGLWERKVIDGVVCYFPVTSDPVSRWIDSPSSFYLGTPFDVLGEYSYGHYVAATNEIREVLETVVVLAEYIDTLRVKQLKEEDS